MCENRSCDTSRVLYLIFARTRAIIPSLFTQTTTIGLGRKNYYLFKKQKQGRIVYVYRSGIEYIKIKEIKFIKKQRRHTKNILFYNFFYIFFYVK